jgi:Ca-activated chloride channel homolog
VNARLREILAAPVLAATLLLLPSAAPLTAQEPRPDDAIELASNLVLVSASARTADGKVVADLSLSEFAIAEDGAPRKIEVFQRDTAPLDVEILVDTSDSTAGAQEVIRRAVADFVRQLRREDAYLFARFSNKPEVVVAWTNERALAASAARSALPRGDTALWGSMLALLRSGFDGRASERRRAVVVLTDGLDTSSGLVTRDHVVRAAQERNASIFVVSVSRLNHELVEAMLGNPAMTEALRRQYRELQIHLREVETVLDELADSTGGRVLYPRKVGDLSSAYAQIAEQMRTRYLLGYYSPPKSAPGFHAIAVTTTRAGVLLAARRGYMRRPE